MDNDLWAKPASEGRPSLVANGKCAGGRQLESEVILGLKNEENATTKRGPREKKFTNALVCGST